MHFPVVDIGPIHVLVKLLEYSTIFIRNKGRFKIRVRILIRIRIRNKMVGYKENSRSGS